MDRLGTERTEPTALERVLAWARSSRLSVPPLPCRSIIEVFAETIAALTSARIKYVLAGTLAYGLYARARATDNITVLVREDARARVQHALGVAGFRPTKNLPSPLDFEDPTTGIDLNVLLAANDVGTAAVDHAEQHSAFGLTTWVINAEYLVWLYCLSDLPRPFANAVELVKAGQVDVENLRCMLLRAGDQATHTHLGRVLKAAEAERRSSYSGSVAARSHNASS
jgi:hypothetical protein